MPITQRLEDLEDIQKEHAQAIMILQDELKLLAVCLGEIIKKD